MDQLEATLDDRTVSRLLELIRQFAGITMETRKRDMIPSRLRPRLRLLGLASYDDYIEYLLSHSDETQEFINCFTTNETSFFRTPSIWQYFQREFLPSWYESHSERALRAWSAAASSGEEAGSIAMLCEEFRVQRPGFHYKVLASDISTDVLDVAKRGLYGGRSFEDLKKKAPLLAAKYFGRDRHSEAYRLNEPVARNIEFIRHNLHQRSPFSLHFDIVFLRNVLIYFNDRDQEKVLAYIHEALVPGGILVIGESESLSRLKTDFHFRDALIYEKSPS